jgi:CheY-like chemotaxis protein
MPDGGRLVIRTGAVVLDEASADHEGLPPGRYARLQVVDTGTGMDEATLAHAFEPFFSTKAPDEGTGLGLATVYGIVSQAGGRASVESQPGRGTTVTALLPATDEAPTERAPTPERVATGKGETVLVVEDNAPMREAARRILARQGYIVLTAVDGAEAIERAEGYGAPIHALLTDVNMPAMAGPEVARRILQARPATKVIYMSGYTAGAVDLAKGLEPGVTLIEKPFDPSQLLETLRAVLDG